MSETADLRVGVRFSLLGHPGELFADARAVEAAGADSLWIDAVDGDPYVALAALAAVTWRVRLFARGAAGPGRETCARLSRGRLVIAEECAEKWVESPFPAGRDVPRPRSSRADPCAEETDGDARWRRRH